MDVFNQCRWDRVLYELNNFGCNIEFIQSKTRDDLIIHKKIKIDDYISKIKDLVDKHECNLYSLFQYSIGAKKHKIFVE